MLLKVISNKKGPLLTLKGAGIFGCLGCGEENIVPYGCNLSANLKISISYESCYV